MPELDRFMLHRLQNLIQRTRAAYEAYEFHVVFHALYNYCTLDLSAFYLDILKDRLYASAPHWPQRRSAQTVLSTTLEALVRLMAPLMAFTAEEIWDHMPDVDARTASVHLELLPQPDPSLRDTALAQRWERLLGLRGEVTKALEAARAQKTIGHPLDAAVTLAADDALFDFLAPYREVLRSLFITSRAVLLKGRPGEDDYQSTQIEGLAVRVERAADQKCERCWIHEPSVGADSDHPSLCDRCCRAVAELDLG
jgi:isoleucyl-tRNA synthetase